MIYPALIHTFHRWSTESRKHNNSYILHLKRHDYYNFPSESVIPVEEPDIESCGNKAESKFSPERDSPLSLVAKYRLIG